jgi:hypothetical protein
MGFEGKNMMHRDCWPVDPNVPLWDQYPLNEDWWRVFKLHLAAEDKRTGGNRYEEMRAFIDMKAKESGKSCNSTYIKKAAVCAFPPLTVEQEEEYYKKKRAAVEMAREMQKRKAKEAEIFTYDKVLPTSWEEIDDEADFIWVRHHIADSVVDEHTAPSGMAVQMWRDASASLSQREKFMAKYLELRKAAKKRKEASWLDEQRELESSLERIESEIQEARGFAKQVLPLSTERPAGECAIPAHDAF